MNFRFNGRATRSEYWGILIGSGVAYFVLVLLAIGIFSFDYKDAAGIFLMLVILFFGLPVMFLQYAVSARRCIDAGITRWWMLTFLLPYIGFVGVIVIGCLSSSSAVEDAVRVDVP